MTPRSPHAAHAADAGGDAVVLAAEAELREAAWQAIHAPGKRVVAASRDYRSRRRNQRAATIQATAA